jgi:glycosyltransferase involved in cell wall biosynthesis
MPAFNEQEAIGLEIDALRRVMDGTSYGYEIIVVDDASTDATAQIAEARGARVIRHTRRKGSGGARKTGIRAANGKFIVMTDADGTYPKKDIPEMVGYLSTHDLVVGARKEEMGTHKVFRTFAKFVIRKIAEFLTGREIPDLNSGLMAFKKEVIEKYLHLIPDGFSCTSSISLVHLANNYEVKYLPIDYYKRIGTSKFHPLRDTSKYLLTVIRIISYFNPLKVFITVSAFLLACGVIKSIASIALSGTLQESDVILVLSSIIIGALGIIADLIVTYGRRE